ncbi:sensor domain-containing diguanylate cyclase [Neptuniibacter sp.]|uniref:sensor domain-containing diguanylate cyclase n=1 Tax=Neptuniibacter sp. TaxID=1962643 RepID=UPI002629B826|nr:sensor domain-containing diguanylate cyclase [Neptuniibacter sp.]MCP4596739.1 GGDEF domain-containing protein [Neptuniibacter sp.]
MSDKQILARYEALLSASADAVMVLEPATGLILACSAGAAEWLDADALIGRKLSDVLPADLSGDITATAVKAADKKAVKTSDIQLRPEHVPNLREQGLIETKWIELRCFAAESEVVAVFRDISSKRRLERQVTSQAQRDPLTGAYNRRALRPVLEQAVAQAQRYDWVCSLMVIDVDDFSKLNDDYSWDCGDQILQQLVTTIHGMKRTSDFLARYGDDQFIMFMPETNHEQGMAAGNRVRKLMEEMEIPYSAGDVRFTVSVGVAALNGPEDDSDNMLRRANENLFIAKQSGCNRVEGEE